MKRSGIAVAAPFVAFAVLIGTVRALASRGHAETESMVVRWQSTGKPFWVEGVVLDRMHMPIAGQEIAVRDDSGGQFATTDEKGRFSVRLGETEAIGIELQGVGSLSLGWTALGGLDATQGLEFDITVKK